MNKSIDKKRLIRLITTVLILFLALYISYRVFSLNNSAYKTQTTLLKTVEDCIDTTVFIVRDEQYLDKIDENKTAVSLVSDGERVADDEVISALFNSREDAENYKKRLFYENELERYNQLLAQEKVNISDIMAFDSKTDDIFEDYIDCIRNNTFDDARQDVYNFCDKITTRQSATGVDVDLTSKITDLNKKINSLKSIVPEFVISNSTGYFVNGIDGYENVIEYDDITNVTTDMIDEAIKTEKRTDSSYTGKIINNFNWYMLCTVTSKDVQDIEVGDYVKVRFVNSACVEEKAQVTAINIEGKDKVALVLRCNTVTSKIFPLRKEKVKIITDSFEGYSVRKDAVRTVDGMNGVYVLRGKIVNFRYVDILLTEDDFVLVRTFEEETNIVNEQIAKKKEAEDNGETYSGKPIISMSKYIRLYDEVITKGGELSDGKIIQ